jgi:hypothetical protein
MLDTLPQAIPNAHLAQAPVATLLEHFAAVLSWLSDGYGLVQTGVSKDSKHRYPQIYLQDGEKLLRDVYPDQNMKSLLFFERNGPSSIEWSDPLHLSGTWSHPLAIVVWLNLPEIDPERKYDFAEEIIADFLTQGLLASPLAHALTFEEVEQRAERVFQRYDFVHKQQLMMYPYSAFRVPVTIAQPYERCAAPFAPGGLGGGPFLIANGKFLRMKL